MRFIVVVLVGLAGSASADSLEKLQQVTRWDAQVVFQDDHPLKTETKTSSCSIGKSCKQVDTSSREDLNGATITSDGKSDIARATVTFKTLLSTRTVQTFTEECGGTVGLNAKPGVQKAGRVDESGTITGSANATAESHIQITVLSGSKYRLSFLVPRVEGTQKLVETYSASGGCSPRKKDIAPPTTSKLYSMEYSIEHEAPLPAVPADLSKLVLSGSGSRGNQKFTWKAKPVPPTDLVADAGPDRKLAWGKQLKLDASKSTPKNRITSYRWKTTSATCATEDELKHLKELEGKVVSFQPLCSLEMELTVSDGKESASTTVQIEVERRAWKTPDVPKTKLDWATKPNAVSDPKWGKPSMTYEGGNNERIWPTKLKWGENVCAHDDKTTVYGITHPHPYGGLVERAEWRGGGLEIATMKGGPFDGWHYVKSSSIVIERKAIFNEWARPDAPPPFPGAKKNVAAANSKVYAKWKLALEQHEGEGNSKRPKVGHTKLIRDALKKHVELDPRRAVEPLASPDKMKLWGKADASLLDLNRKLGDISGESDVDITPDKIIWQGDFLYWNTTVDDWVPAKESM